MTQPKTQPTKVSAGALRAAAAINHGWVEGIHEMGVIIDRETGLAELLEAAKLKRNVIINEYTTPKFSGRWVAVPEEDFGKLEQAIAKVEGSE